MRVKKAYLKSERVQEESTKLKSERVQSPTVSITSTGKSVTVKVGAARRPLVKIN
ncbi:MAG TPA: hypothetical protein VH394_17165 [Thermoanaerobaculia bacterium]|jgi:hypothetical protein|nr:hypothetical protein [Thermoanaerobaculia bacterium]